MTVRKPILQIITSFSDIKNAFKCEIVALIYGNLFFCPTSLIDRIDRSYNNRLEPSLDMGIVVSFTL